MCGITDSTGGADRFAQFTLESRFGVDQTWNLIQAWQDNWMTASDWDNIAAMGFNYVRVPFSYLNLQRSNGSWITDSDGNVDFSCLDGVIAEAKQRNLGVILVFHIWQGQDTDYSLISEDSDAGQSERDAAGLIWQAVANHFLGESTIIAYDAINEPTGSAGDILQQDLYKAIRSVDSARIIIMESISTDPSTYGWNNTVYSLHEYLMMGSDESYNQGQFWSGVAGVVSTWQSYGIPAYVGEFMAQDSTLPWMLDQLNELSNVPWSSWAYKTVNMGGWGTANYPGWSVDVGSDDYDTIMNQWTNMGTPNQNTDIYSTYVNAAAGSTSQKRKRTVVMSERAGQTKRFHAGHARRSRMHAGRGSA